MEANHQKEKVILLMQRIAAAVEGLRTFIFTFGLGSSIFIIAFGSFEWFLILIPILVGAYFCGLVIIAQVLQSSLSEDEVISVVQRYKIQSINERLADGTLEPGSNELEALMAEAGLEPLTVIVQLGPIFGHLGDVSLHDWIDAKKGSDGETLRYEYVGKAVFEVDGTVQVTDEKFSYIVIDGILYRHDPNLKTDDTPAQN